MALSILDIITVDYLKNTTIAGVDLTLDDGSDFSDDIFTSAIEQAVAMVESDLGIIIDPFSLKAERHDVDIIDRHNHYTISLDLKPLRSVDKLNIQIGNNDLAEMPADYATIASHLYSKINLIPTTAGGLRFVSGSPFLVGDIFSPYSKFPSYFSIDYSAGHTFIEGTATIAQNTDEVTISLAHTFPHKFYTSFEITQAGGGAGLRVISYASDSITVKARTAPTTDDLIFKYSVNDVDPNIIRAVSLIASMLPLNIAGDLLLGAGVASQSIGIDGLSQSIASTASATSAGFGARLIEYNSELKSVMKTLRAKYKNLNFYAR